MQATRVRPEKPDLPPSADAKEYPSVGGQQRGSLPLDVTQLERRVALRSPTFLLDAAAFGSALSRPGAHRRSLSGCVDSGESGHGLGWHFVSLGCFPGSSSLSLDVGKKKEVQSPRSTLHLHDMNPSPFVNPARDSPLSMPPLLCQCLQQMIC